jgi:hypothetical protein
VVGAGCRRSGEPARPSSSAETVTRGDPFVVDHPRDVEAERSRPSHAALFAPAAATHRPPVPDVRVADDASVPATVTTVDPSAPVGPSADAIRAVLLRNRDGLGDCVAAAWRRGERLSGMMEVELVIDRRGRVRATRVLTARFRDSVVGACLTGRVESWRFSPWRGRTKAVVILPYAIEAPR